MTSRNADGRVRVMVAARLSDAGDRTEESRIERDEERARAWADVNDADVVTVTKDRGVSGALSPFKRPKLGPYLTRAALIGTYDVIVGDTIDRLGRDARDMDELKAWAEDNGKQLIVIKNDLIWPPPPGASGHIQRIMWSLLADLAQIERETIIERIEGGLTKARANDGFIGKPSFGFRSTGPKYKRTLEVDFALEPVLRGMIDQAMASKGFASIARWLNTTGVLPPQAGRGVKGSATASDLWSAVSVAQILRSPDLKGRRTESGRTYKFDSLLTASEWNALQDKLPKGQRGPISSETPFLTGVIVCESCGGPMYRIQSSKKRVDGTRSVNRYYRCRGTDQTPSRCANMVPQDDIEAWVDLWFTADGPFARTEIIETTTVPGDDHQEEVEEIEAEMREAVIDHPERVEALRAERARLLSLPSEPMQLVERSTGWTVGDVWNQLDEGARRTYLLAAGVKVHVLSSAALRAQSGAEIRYIDGNPHRVTGTLRGIVEAA